MEERHTIDLDSIIVYIAMSILCSAQNSLIPEILYIFSPKQVMDFIKIFGGETIYIPTPKQFSRELMAGIACYHVIIEEKSWDWFFLYYEINGNAARSIKTIVEKWWTQLSETEKEFINSLKLHAKSQKKTRSMESEI